MDGRQLGRDVSVDSEGRSQEEAPRVVYEADGTPKVYDHLRKRYFIHKAADGHLEVATTTMETKVIEIAKLNGEVTVAKGDVALTAEEGFTAVDGFSNVFIRKTADGKLEVATTTMAGTTLVSVK